PGEELRHSGVAGRAGSIDDGERHLEVFLHQLAGLARELIGAATRSPWDDELDRARRIFFLAEHHERERGEAERRQRLQWPLDRMCVEHLLSPSIRIVDELCAVRPRARLRAA